MGITSSKPTGNGNISNGINGGIVGNGSNNVNLNSPSSLKTIVDRKPHTKQKRNKSRNLSTDSKSSSCSSPTNNYLTEELVMDLNSLDIDTVATGTSAGTTVVDMRTSIGEKQIQQKQQQLLQQHILQQQLLQQQAQVTSPIQQNTHTHHQQHENTILDQDDGEFNNNFESESEVESISSSSVHNNGNGTGTNSKLKNKVKQATTTTGNNKIQNSNKNNSSNDLKSKYSYEDGSTSKSNSTLSLYSNISNLHSIQDASIVCENCNHHMTKPIHLLSLSMEPTSASSLDIHRNGNFSITLASNSRSSSPATILQQHHQHNSQQPPPQQQQQHQILNSNGKFFLVNSSANIINTSLNSNNNNINSNINNNINSNNSKDNCSDNNSNNDIPDPSWSNYNSDNFNNNNNNSNNNVFNAFLQSPFLQTIQQQETREEVTSPLIQEITSPSPSPPTVLTQELPPQSPQQQSPQQPQSQSSQQTSPPQLPYQQLLQNNSNNSNNSNNNNNNLASSMGSTSELFNKSLINSFLNNQGINSSSATNPFENSYKNNMNNSTNSGTNANANANNNLKSFLSNSNSSFSALKDLSYEAKDMTFSITLSNSELNSMIADSLNRSSASNSIVKSNNVSNGNSSDGYGMVSAHQSTTTTTPTQQSSHNNNIHHHHHNNNSNNSNKDITFLVSDNPDSIKEKSNVSNTSSIISASNLNRHQHTPNSSASMSARPRGRSISESLFMSPSNKESLNDIQRAIESEKIKKTKFEELKSILGEREDIIDINDIQFIQKVGEGAFSEVWEGWWKGIHVAIKKLKIIGDEEQFKERFIREVQNLKKGNHANIVMFIGACYKPACIITEYMAGGSLYNILHSPNNTQKVKYSFPLVLKMATDMALGLLHLHSITIVHRDLTSQNILLDELGNIKISDFGLSREKSREGSMTMTNGGICNPRWRPPELTKNLGHYSEKVDVYCFSLVVWEILTGEIPYAELDGSQASAQVAYAGLRPPIPEFCDPDLKALLVQCWLDDPNERPHFTFIVDKLKEISWNNPIGFVSDQFYQYSEPSTPRSNISLSPTTTTNNNK